jgi:hypothetical protein
MSAFEMSLGEFVKERLSTLFIYPTAIIPPHFQCNTHLHTQRIHLTTSTMSLASDLGETLQRTDMVELKRLSKNNFYFRSKSIEALRDCIHRLLRSWLVNIYSFINILSEGESIISGSAALAMGFPKYEPYVKDLDVYVGKNGWVLEQYLMNAEGALQNSLV